MTDVGGMTWGDLAKSGLTWGELAGSGLTWGDLMKLDLDEVREFVGVARPAVRSLSPSELRDLGAGLRDGSLGPDAVQDAPPEAAGARSVAQMIWEKVGPKTRGDVVAYLALLVSIVQVLQGAAPQDAPPVEVHVEVVQPGPSSAPTTAAMLSPGPSPDASPDASAIPPDGPRR